MIGNLREQDELTSKAARLLADGNALDAFRVAERLCRHYRRPDARHFLLRAQASIELRDVLAARADLHRAMDIDPTDAAIADTVLRMARDPDATLLRRAASTIVASPRSSSAGLAAAIDVLAPSSPIIAQCRLMENRLEGWVTWAGGDRISGRLRRSDGSDFEFTVSPEAGHELASSARKAATLSRSVPADSLPHLTWWIEDDASAAKAMTTISAEPPIAALRRPGTRDDDMATATKGVGCSVVVPIYDDAMATARCLDSLAAQTMDLSLTIIMVNDRPGDETMNILTRLAAKRFGFKLIVNAANLGFVEAVKRGIAAADTRDDIILLNADTVLPARALARLSAAAYSRRDIGTVTPLSNDGELTSFPNPNKANRLGDLATVQDLDATAQRVNIGRVVTLPNGVGFCLYVKRACLDAIGGVPDAYHRGYFEDVELCLRARFAGYKNVCATDVYVGHAGSRSFKEDKKLLVSLNAKILKSRFPRFLEDGLAFVKADPLREAREAIAWASRRTVPRSRLVICASPRSFALHHRLKRLRGSRKKVFTLARTSPPRTSVFAFSSVDSEFHHDSVVDLARDDDRCRLLARIRQVGITCVEIIDDPGLEPAFATALQAQFPVRWILDEAPLSSIGEHVLARTSDGSRRTATRHR